MPWKSSIPFKGLADTVGGWSSYVGWMVAALVRRGSDDAATFTLKEYWTTVPYQFLNKERLQTY